MTTPKKRTAEELREATRQAKEADEAMERSMSLSDAEIARELVDAGVDLAKLDSIAAIAEEKVLGPPAEPAKVVRLPKREEPRDPLWMRYVLYVAAGVAALCAASFGAVSVAHYMRDEPPSITPDNTPPGPPSRSPQQMYADRLRKDALEACAARRWDDCTSGLDQAKASDPAGDATPEVQAARAAAAKAADAVTDGGAVVDGGANDGALAIEGGAWKALPR